MDVERNNLAISVATAIIPCLGIGATETYRAKNSANSKAKKTTRRMEVSKANHFF